MIRKAFRITQVLKLGIVDTATSLAPYNHVQDPVLHCKIFVRDLWRVGMALLMVLDSFPVKYMFFLDFLVEQNFDPKFLNVDVIALKLVHGAQNCLKMEPKIRKFEQK